MILLLDLAPGSPFALREPRTWVILAAAVMVAIVVRFVLHRLRGPKGGGRS
ncbi:MAG TPA: hypothetical protein VFS00_01040 [Polyangiaceae bacterium]|nr:hypothetical protein [Polyangiaceae bacterium]